MDGRVLKNPFTISYGIVLRLPLHPVRAKIDEATKGFLEDSHDPVQVFYPSSSRLITGIKGPEKLKHDGAVVFGHNFSCKFRWRNNGQEGLEQGYPPLPVSRSLNTPAPQDYSSKIQATNRSLESRSSHSHHSTASETTPSSISTNPAYSTPPKSISCTTQDIPDSDMSPTVSGRDGVRITNTETRKETIT